MHGMAHGIIPDVMEMTHQIFDKYCNRKSFYDYANPIMEDIVGFWLDYCKLKLLPKAAQVGENVFGFSRVMLYLYGSQLRNNPLVTSKIAAITAYHLWCMWNAYQAFISVLMTEKPVTKTDIDNKVKMLMSSLPPHSLKGSKARSWNDQKVRSPMQSVTVTRNYSRRSTKNSENS